MNRNRALRYVGSKIRIAPRIAEQLDAVTGDCLVDVFGGSGAVTMNSGYDKRVYNDLDGDVVNFFKVLSDDSQRRNLLCSLKRTPMSRGLFESYDEVYVKGGRSFSKIKDVVERAKALFYRSSFAFGGKVKNGGFGATLSDRIGCKEIKRYYTVLRELARLGEFWKGTVIECLDFRLLIRAYQQRPGVIFYCDPPYFGTEDYYSRKFGEDEHMDLHDALTFSPAGAVVSYYDCEFVRDTYLESEGWRYVEIEATKNSMGRSKKKAKVTELLICKKRR